MSIREISPDEIRAGQTIRVTHRWEAYGISLPYVRSYEGVVMDDVTPSHNYVSLRSADGFTGDSRIRNTGVVSVSITLLAETPDPRVEAIVQVFNRNQVAFFGQGRSVARQIVEALDEVRDA